jgi:hypothetical protein
VSRRRSNANAAGETPRRAVRAKRRGEESSASACNEGEGDECWRRTCGRQRRDGRVPRCGGQGDGCRRDTDTERRGRSAGGENRLRQRAKTETSTRCWRRARRPATARRTSAEARRATRSCGRKRRRRNGNPKLQAKTPTPKRGEAPEVVSPLSACEDGDGGVGGGRSGRQRRDG